MNKIPARSLQAAEALEVVKSLQLRFVRKLEALGGQSFLMSEWYRDAGRHGGGNRLGCEDSPLLARASVNVSQVHYDDEPDRKLGSATAISTIVHPENPNAPSVHIHISWTEMKNGEGYWRIMADLNPSIPNQDHINQFMEALQNAGGVLFDVAREQGDRYFFIPALGRYRGVIHFYLENYNSGSFSSDLQYARTVGEAAIDEYVQILADAGKETTSLSEADKAAQLAYHTLYFFQVLTLDRGTTTGLLVHNQNDVGILGSLPPRVDKNLLSSWGSRMEEPQNRLLDQLISVLPNTGTCTIDKEIKQKLAQAVRDHYQKYPEALSLQASGNTTPPTIDNHR